MYAKIIKNNINEFYTQPTNKHPNVCKHRNKHQNIYKIFMVDGIFKLSYFFIQNAYYLLKIIIFYLFNDKNLVIKEGKNCK